MIRSVKIIRRKHKSRSAGYGFVEMEDARVHDAVKALGRTLYNGQNLRIYLTLFSQGVQGDVVSPRYLYYV
ncbi:MAG: RNA-binding protein [Nitrospira sp.]|nr:RNA-binding protein [Nitrospira sp.]